MIVTSVNLDSVMSQTSVWVFGYGSLLWKIGFPYSKAEVGFIRGYKRRFWQGNETHRGTKHMKGRVATLLPKSKGTVWGIGYQICGKSDIETAMSALCTREMTLGGYIVTSTTFYPRDPDQPRMNVLLFMATEDNSLYLGRAPISKMAVEIVRAKGTAGPNSDYVTNLADYIRLHIPEDHDKHLFKLDRKIRELKNFIYMDSTLWNKFSAELHQHTDNMTKPKFGNMNENDQIIKFSQNWSNDALQILYNL